MNEDKLKGKAKDIGGRIERQAGEWTGDKEMQREGAKEQVKGKAQNVKGDLKDAARDLGEDKEKTA
jgi:uncharacterized protein YjbJ (UPF0337 family)